MTPASRDTTTRFGAAVRAARLRRHMTQPELADASGVPQSTISLVERGRKGTRPYHPDAVTARRIAAVLGGAAGECWNAYFSGQ